MLREGSEDGFYNKIHMNSETKLLKKYMFPTGLNKLG